MKSQSSPRRQTDTKVAGALSPARRGQLRPNRIETVYYEHNDIFHCGRKGGGCRSAHDGSGLTCLTTHTTVFDSSPQKFPLIDGLFSLPTPPLTPHRTT